MAVKMSDRPLADMKPIAGRTPLAVCFFMLLLVLVVLAREFHAEREVTERHLAEAVALHDHSLPYYSPALRNTVNWSERPFLPDKVLYYGMPLNMVVASDITRTVIGIINGHIAWSRKYPEIWPRAMDIHEGILYVGSRRSIDAVDYLTGEIIAKIEVPTSHEIGSINGIRFRRIEGAVFVSIAFDMPGKDEGGAIISSNGGKSTASIMIFRLDEGSPPTLRLSVADANGAHYPRDVLYIDGGYIVADTYWHRVYFVQHRDKDSKSAAFYPDVSVFYPNTVDVMDIGGLKEIIVAAEHENRVFSLDLKTGKKQLLMYCPHPPFDDPVMDADQMIRHQVSTAARETGTTPPRSLCATEHSGLWTLYSPNSARAHNGRIIIADTDNHLVKVVDGKKMLALVAGIPNPVNAILF